MEHLPVSALVNFALLLTLLVYVGRKPIRRALAKRHEGVSRAVEEAEALRRSVEEMVRDYEAKLAGLDAEVARILADARAEGEKEGRRILERAEETAEKIREDALRRAEKELVRARRALEAELFAEASAAAAAILRRRVTEEDHRRFAEELMRKLEEGDGRSH